MKNIRNLFQNVKNNLAHISCNCSKGLLVALFAFPILPLPVANIIFIAFSAFTLLAWFLNGRPAIRKYLARNLLLTLPFIPYLIEFIIFRNNPVAGFEMEKKLLFFIAPVAFAFYISTSKPLDFKFYLRAFSIALILLSVYSLILLVTRGILFSPSSYAGDSSELRLKFEDISGLHPTYFGFFACITIFWVLYDFKNLNSPQKWVVGILTCILLFVDVLIAAKMSLIILLLGVLFILYKITTRKKYLLLAYTLTALLLSLLLLIPSLRERMFEMKDLVNSTSHNYNSVNERKVIFMCSWNTFKSNFFFGVGSRNMQQYLNMSYWVVYFAQGIFTNYNSHNQFLTLGINYGIFDVVFFLGSILYAVRKVWRTGFLLVSVVSTVLIMLTESILERQMGIYFYVLFFLIAYNYIWVQPDTSAHAQNL